MHLENSPQKDSLSEDYYIYPHIRFMTLLPLQCWQGGVHMAKKKYRIVLSDFQHRLLIIALAEFRNQLLEINKPTEAINELLLKVIDAPRTRRWR